MGTLFPGSVVALCPANGAWMANGAPTTVGGGPAVVGFLWTDLNILKHFIDSADFSDQ